MHEKLFSPKHHYAALLDAWAQTESNAAEKKPTQPINTCMHKKTLKNSIAHVKEHRLHSICFLLVDQCVIAMLASTIWNYPWD